MGALSPTHWLIIVGVLVLLFGAKRLPDAARSLGRSARILKAEVHDITDPAPGGHDSSGTAPPDPAVPHPAASAAATVTPALSATPAPSPAPPTAVTSPAPVS